MKMKGKAPTLLWALLLLPSLVTSHMSPVPQEEKGSREMMSLGWWPVCSSPCWVPDSLNQSRAELKE